MLCEIVDFPKIPTDILNLIIEEFEQKRNMLVPIEGFEYFKMLPSAQNSIDSKNPIEQNLKNNIGISPSQAREIFGDKICYFGLMNAPKLLNQWVFENIKIKNVHCGIQEFELGKCFVPHVDLTRTTAYNYIISAGGCDVKTTFYKPKPQYDNFNITSRTLIPYERIDEIESVICEEHKWYKLDVSQIHSVENLDPTKKRLSITISVIE